VYRRSRAGGPRQWCDLGFGFGFDFSVSVRCAVRDERWLPSTAETATAYRPARSREEKVRRKVLAP
jgi:hypothetical protein